MILTGERAEPVEKKKANFRPMYERTFIRERSFKSVVERGKMVVIFFSLEQITINLRVIAMKKDSEKTTIQRN